MNNWKLLCCTLLVVVTGCASSSNSRYSRQWRPQQFGGHARVYNNGSHPLIGKLPQTDVPLVVNDAVMKWVAYFTGNPGSRDRFARYLQRSGRYLDMMREALRRRGMPQDLVYVALIESGFRNDAQSWASAVGTWQFIRSTARGYGLNIDSYIDERRDPEKAVEAAASYLKNLYDEFGDWYLAMAGYNAGEGRVRSAVARYGSKNFWQLAAMGNGAFRPETRDYVPKYIAATIIAKNPKRFGFHRVDYHDPLEYDTAQIKGQADLMAVADAVNVPVDVIQDLNPELYAGVTPPGQYMVKLPVGTSQRFKRDFPRVAKKYQVTTQSMMAYRVRRGDSVGRIARRYGVSTRQLMAANHLRSGYLRAGQVLSIPSASVRTPSTARVVAVAPAVERAVGPETLLAQETFGGTTATSYTIQSGDRLSTIAHTYGVTVTDLRRWNKLRGRTLRVGQLLRIKAPTDIVKGLSERTTVAMEVPATVLPPKDLKTGAPTTRPAARPVQTRHTYRVQRGDSLYVIAKRYGVRVADLKAWNRMSSPKLRVGQQLVIRGEAAAKETMTIAQAPRATPPTATAASTTVADITTAAGSSYRVRTGDTLGQIAERHNMTVTELRRLNRLTTRAVIRAGQTLMVRGVPGAPAGSPGEATTPAVATSQPKSLWSDRVSLSAALKPKAKELVYQVKPGDTLWDISRAYEVKPEEIQDWNNLSHPNLKPGQKLTIRITS